MSISGIQGRILEVTGTDFALNFLAHIYLFNCFWKNTSTGLVINLLLSYQVSGAMLMANLVKKVGAV